MPRLLEFIQHHPLLVGVLALALLALVVDELLRRMRKYRELAEEYLHYFHGRNPLSEVYLSNRGSKGANLAASDAAK